MHTSEGSEVATRHHPRGASYRGGELAESETLFPATGAPVPEMRVTVTVVGGPPAGGEGCVVEIRGLVGLVGGKGHRGHLVEFRAPVVGSEPHCFDRVVSHGELGLAVPRGRHGWPERAMLFIVIIATLTRFNKSFAILRRVDGPTRRTSTKSASPTFAYDQWPAHLARALRTADYHRYGETGP